MQRVLYNVNKDDEKKTSDKTHVYKKRKMQNCCCNAAVVNEQLGYVTVVLPHEKHAYMT